MSRWLCGGSFAPPKLPGRARSHFGIHPPAVAGQPARQPSSQAAASEKTSQPARTDNQQPSRAGSKPTIVCLRKKLLTKMFLDLGRSAVVYRLIFPPVTLKTRVQFPAAFFFRVGDMGGMRIQCLLWPFDVMTCGSSGNRFACRVSKC
jgi:hypothetical protein